MHIFERGVQPSYTFEDENVNIITVVITCCQKKKKYVFHYFVLYVNYSCNSIMPFIIIENSYFASMGLHLTFKNKKKYKKKPSLSNLQLFVEKSSKLAYLSCNLVSK